MFRQKSFENQEGGKLYVVATPIGNLEDITFRALTILKEVDLIAAEDTRQTKKLLTHFEIHTPLVSYHEHSSANREAAILSFLKEGKQIALVSDAGLPGISDPGEDLVAMCIEEQIPVIPIPGVNAALSGLVCSGLPAKNFTFIGFLPRESKKRVEMLQDLKERPETLIFYESPHRIKEMVKDLYQIFEDRRMVIAREITKRYEEFLHGTTQEILELCETESLKGEMTIIIEGFVGEPEVDGPWWESLSVTSHVDIWIEKGLTTKEAIKKVAEERNVPKREIYNEYHQ